MLGLLVPATVPGSTSFLSQRMTGTCLSRLPLGYSTRNVFEECKSRHTDLRNLNYIAVASTAAHSCILRTRGWADIQHLLLHSFGELWSYYNWSLPLQVRKGVSSLVLHIETLPSPALQEMLSATISHPSPQPVLAPLTVRRTDPKDMDGPITQRHNQIPAVYHGGHSGLFQAVEGCEEVAKK